MADQGAFQRAVQQVGALRDACNAMRDNCHLFRDNVNTHTDQLRGVVATMGTIRGNIAEIIGLMRERMDAAAAAAAGFTQEDAAAAVQGALQGANLNLEGLEDANAALGAEVQNAATALADINQLVAAADPRGGVQRGGWTPNPPACRGCCGRGTRRNKKTGKCHVRRKKKSKRKKRRRGGKRRRHR